MWIGLFSKFFISTTLIFFYGEASDVQNGTSKIYRNKLTKLKDNAKRTYYQNELHLHKENISKQWKIINEIVCY